jgi:hypothetical protein
MDKSLPPTCALPLGRSWPLRGGGAISLIHASLFWECATMDGRDGASRSAQGDALSPGLTNFTKELSGWPIRSTAPFVSTLVTSIFL